MRRRKSRGYQPRKRRTKHPRNLAYLHAEEERIILRDVLDRFGGGTFSAANLALAFPMRYDLVKLRGALKRMRGKSLYGPASSTRGVYHVRKDVLNAYAVGRERGAA